jgi:hypothetical protein
LHDFRQRLDFDLSDAGPDDLPISFFSDRNSDAGSREQVDDILVVQLEKT